MDMGLMRRLRRPAETTIVLLVLDGLGGAPGPGGGPTELEAADTPELDRLAREGICGLHQPVASGITPGSGPAHLALFGYDPLTYEVGRGVLSALGIGFELGPDDVAARGNFCTLDENGRIADRRAGRIGTDTCRELCDILSGISLPGVELIVRPVKQHRFLLVLRGEGLSGEVGDTDPQTTGVRPNRPSALNGEAQPTAKLVLDFEVAARSHLARRFPANGVLLRGFSRRPEWPQLNSVLRLRAAVLAGYPMYRGVAQLVGMQVLDAGDELGDRLEAMVSRWDDFDFFFVHHKGTDSAGEDGDFERKVREIETVDRHLPRLLEAQPDVVLVTGDHSTPWSLSSHSWHPVPVLLWSRRGIRPDRVDAFGERSCLAGALGPRFPAAELMPLAMAHAGRLDKLGA